ncbi:MAG: sarcosine oxidase, gamma subunit [Gammaproteobacteria bacterium]|nr:sarcosine oxidase, gamma subunit [Gammaproteobacteria bacterium]
MPEPVEAPRLLPPATRFILQCGKDARDAAGRGFGLALPEAACRAESAGGRAALWLGPDERLLLAPAGLEDVLAGELEAALGGLPHSLVDVSHRQAALAVAGPAARELLSHGCPLDLDDAVFPVGMCTRTVLGRAEVVLWRSRPEEYHLETGRSFASYVLGWLREAEQGG